jgi:hypothetical protein
MAQQFFIPGDGVVNTGDSGIDYFIPGSGVVNEPAVGIPSASYTLTGGIIFGGSVAYTAEGPTQTETLTGGIIFGGGFDYFPEISETLAGGIIFGGTLRTRITNPMAVAVKAGTFRIGGVTYTLAGTLTVPRITGSIAQIITCNAAPAAGSGLYRYDIITVGIDRALHYTAGTPATAPALPATPSAHLLCGWVLLYPGLTEIQQSDINKTYAAPVPVRITAVASDDELAWAETTSTITVTVYDQYSQPLPGTWTIDAVITSGNGTLAPASASTAGANHAHFTYTRGGADPGDVSPWLTFTMSYGGSPSTSRVFIKLLDAGGALMT